MIRRISANVRADALFIYAVITRQEVSPHRLRGDLISIFLPHCTFAAPHQSVTFARANLSHQNDSRRADIFNVSQDFPIYEKYSISPYSCILFIYLFIWIQFINLKKINLTCYF